MAASVDIYEAVESNPNKVKCTVCGTHIPHAKRLYHLCKADAQ